MDYDGLIGELYDVCHEYENQMMDENESDLDFLQQLYALNFEVRKNGIKGLGSSESNQWDSLDDDSRIAFNAILSDLTRLSDVSCIPNVSLHLDIIKENLISEGIDGLKPY